MAAANDIYIAIPQKYSDVILVKVTLTIYLLFLFFFQLWQEVIYLFIKNEQYIKKKEKNDRIDNFYQKIIF